MSRSRNTFARLMCGAAVLALAGFAGAANAAEYDIAPQPLAMALKEFGMKTGQPVLYGPSLADAKMSRPVIHSPDAVTALMAMLDGTGLPHVPRSCSRRSRPAGVIFHCPMRGFSTNPSLPRFESAQAVRNSNTG